MAVVLQRGLEYHTLNLDLRLPAAPGEDSLFAVLHAEGLEGFREYNDRSHRMAQRLRIDWLARRKRPLSGILRLEQTLFNESTDLRETIRGRLAGGVYHGTGALRGSVLAGAVAERRQVGGNLGPLLESDLGLAGDPGGWSLDGRAGLRLENPGPRRNRMVELRLGGATGEAPARESFELLLKRRQEDLYPDPRQSALERRNDQNLELRNTLATRPAEWLNLAVRVEGWSREKRRRRLGSQTGVSGAGRSGHFEDLGFRAGLTQESRRGPLHSTLGFTVLRQRQDSRYDSPAGLSRNLSRIRANRLEGWMGLSSARDSLFLRGLLEMRRRDTDFSLAGGSSADPDYSDRFRRELLLGLRKAALAWATFGVELGLILDDERHLQAGRSAGNYGDRSYRAAFLHAVDPGQSLRLRGRTSVLTKYRLFDYDDAELPRSYVQRRFRHLQEVRAPLPSSNSAGSGGSASFLKWRQTLELKMLLILEDGGSFRREQRRELLSNSAQELQCDLAWVFSSGAWSVEPGIRWYNHRDFTWELQKGSRSRSLTRALFRRGPALRIRERLQGREGSLRILWERVDDNTRQSWNLWVDLNIGIDF